MRLPLWIGIAGLTTGIVSAHASASGATLPAHEALSVLIVTDAVNPNQLSPAELTEPADFAPALTADDSGLNLDNVITVDSQCADEAIAALEGEARPDVVLYFAHRAAKSCAGGDAQASLVSGLEAGLRAGMGVVAFHHGLYGDLYTPGAKNSILRLVGAESSGIAWNTTVGQRVFIIGGSHFVTSNGLTPEGEAPLGAVGGVPAGSYPYFDNIPDERYPTTDLLTETGEERSPLFATDSGGDRLLGYALTRPGWTGRVVAYQPGEYQPNALDDRAGNNFQVLANSIYFAAFGQTESVPSDTGSPLSSTDSQTTAHEASASSHQDAATGTSSSESPSDISTAPSTSVSPPPDLPSSGAAVTTIDTNPAPSSAPSIALVESTEPDPSTATRSVPNSSTNAAGSGCGIANSRRVPGPSEQWPAAVSAMGISWLVRRHSSRRNRAPFKS